MTLPLFVDGISDVGRQRERNEDYLHAEQMADGAWLLIVCDGMGGHEAGEVASRFATETIVNHVASQTDAVAPYETLYEALHEANQGVLDQAAVQGTPSMGTTAVVAYVRGRECWVGWVGDSRLYQFRHGQKIDGSTDHTRVQQLLDLDLISPEEARNHPEAHVLLQALGGGAGAQQHFRPSVWQEPVVLEPGDVLLLCSGGLYDLVDDDEIYPLISGCAPREGAQALIDLVYERGAHDNVTVAILVAGQDRVPVPGEATPAAGALATSAAPQAQPSTKGLALLIALLVGLLVGLVLGGGAGFMAGRAAAGSDVPTDDLEDVGTVGIGDRGAEGDAGDARDPGSTPALTPSEGSADAERPTDVEGPAP